MHPKYIALILFIYIVAAIMTSVMEDGTVAIADDKESTVKSVTDFEQISSDQSWAKPWKVVTTPFDYFRSINDILFLKASFLDNADSQYAELFRWIVLTPMVGLVIYGFIMVLVGVFSRILT